MNQTTAEFLLRFRGHVEQWGHDPAQSGVKQAFKRS